MAEKWQKWWKSIVIGLVIITVLALLAFIVINRNEPWTGFGEQQITETSTRTEISGGNETVTETIKPVPAKNLWDWLDLFIVSLAIALALFLLNMSQKRRESERQKEDQRQITLRDYYEKMSNLLLVEVPGEQSSRGKKRLSTLARAITLAILPTLDPDRVAALFQFLRDAELNDTISLEEGRLQNVNWYKVDLRGTNLRGAKLYRSNLREVDLSRADLKGAKLFRSNLRGADLRKTDLLDADLLDADLGGANLSGANLSGTDLRVVDLRGADLSEANLSGANLSGAKLSGTKLGWTNWFMFFLTWIKAIGAIDYRWYKLRTAGLLGVNLHGRAVRIRDLAKGGSRENPLTWDDLREADMVGPNLLASNFIGANLKRAKYSKSTIWPDGFNPVEAGAILVDEEGNPIEDSDEEE